MFKIPVYISRALCDNSESAFTCIVCNGPLKRITTRPNFKVWFEDTTNNEYIGCPVVLFKIGPSHLERLTGLWVNGGEQWLLNTDGTFDKID